MSGSRGGERKREREVRKREERRDRSIDGGTEKEKGIAPGCGKRREVRRI